MGDLQRGQNKNSGILSKLKTALDRSRLGELLVMKGMISPRDLRFALRTQKQTSQPLGQIFIKHAMISRWQLTLILGRQMALRTAMTAMLCLVSVYNWAPKKAKADMINDVPAKIALSQQVSSLNYAKIKSFPGLFGTDEKRSTNLKPFTKWTGMFEKFNRELQNPSSMALIRDWQKNLEAIQPRSLKTLAAEVNILVNKKRYILDDKNWGKSDYWATPVEFLKNGGDCEDFAIAKYTALRAFGVPEERLRLAIVHDNVKNIPHAVLVVYTDEGPYILDNQIKTLVNAAEEGRYRPIFSINRTAWWLHTAPKTTVLASAE